MICAVGEATERLENEQSHHEVTARREAEKQAEPQDQMTVEKRRLLQLIAKRVTSVRVG